jgi:hypothetical protein
MILQVAPKPQVMQRAAQLRAQQEKLRAQAASEGRELPPEPEMPQDDSGEDDDDDDDEDEGTGEGATAPAT